MKSSIRKSIFAVLLAVFLGGNQTAVAGVGQPRTVNGTVTGLAFGTAVVLTTNGEEMEVASNRAFEFDGLAVGTAYNIVVKEHPSYPAGNCTVTGGAGTVTEGIIPTVEVRCTPLPQITSLRANVDARFAHAVTLDWFVPPISLPAAVEYNLYVSTSGRCDFGGDSFTLCPGEKVQSAFPGADPFTASTIVTQFRGERLKNGQDYFVRVETVFANGAKGLSNLARARPNELAFNGNVRAITAAPDGTVYLGGDFSSVGVATGSAVPLDLAKGKLATPSFDTPTFPAVAGIVNVVVPDGAGGWYIGGQFTHVGGVPQRNLTHILSSGGVDTRWRMFPDGPVHALEHLGSTLFVGGSFNSVAFVPGFPGIDTGPHRNVAALFDDGQNMYTWSPSPNKTVRALKVFGDRLYMGGDFTAGNGKPGFFAAFALRDQLPFLDQPLPFDMNLDGPVRALTSDGRALFVGGSFKRFGNVARVNVAKIVLVGGTPSVDEFHPDPGVTDGFPSSVNALAVDTLRGSIYLGGTFTSIRTGTGGIAVRTNLAQVSSAGGTLDNWTPDPDSTVESLAVKGIVVYVGGRFDVIGSNSARLRRFNLAAIDTINGAILTGFAPEPGATVRALAIAGSTLYAGGDFNFLNRTDRRSFAAVHANGSLLAWDPNAGNAGGTVNALVYHNNRFRGPVVYAGGSFNSIHGRSNPNLAALNASTGSLLDSGSFLGTANGPVNALAVLENSEALYVGGSFTSIANSPANNLAKLFLFNGTINLDFKPQPTGPIDALVATTDAVRFTDVIYAGGSFSSIRKHDSTQGRVNLAKIDADSGTALDEFVVNPNGPVTTLALSRDPHAIYVGGEFDRINGTLIGAPGAGGLASVEIDGSPLLTGCNPCFNPGPDGGRPQALATYPLGFGERVFAGGSFPNIGGGPISNFAALTGYSYGAPTGFSSGSFVFPNGPVSALAVVGNRVYVGGTFSGFHGSYNGSFSGGVRGNFGVVDAATGELIN